jgi:hypothetical protein
MNAIILFAEAPGDSAAEPIQGAAEGLSYWAGLSEGYQPDLRQWSVSARPFGPPAATDPGLLK